MTKWTPGPWLSAPVLSQETGYGWDINADEIWLGTVFNSHRGHEGFPADDVGEANAHLIAAAPELYAALEGVIDNIEDYERVNNLHPSPGRHDCWQSVTIAKAALAKARGET